MMGTLISLVNRVFFIAAFALLILAVINWFLMLFGWRFSWLSYESGRLFEFSAMLMIVVVALLLRQIRDALKK